MSFWGLRLKDMPQLLEQYSLEQICAMQWKRAVEKCQEDLKPIPESRKYFLRYEDFVQNPEARLKGLLQFLGAADDIDVADLVKNVSSKNIGKYQRQLNAEQISEIEQITSVVDIRGS